MNAQCFSTGFMSAISAPTSTTWIASLTADLDMAFKEDKVILERIQLEEERDPNYKRIILGIDAAPMKMRRMVDKLILAELETAH